MLNKAAGSASVIPVPATNGLVLGKLIHSQTTLSSDMFQFCASFSDVLLVLAE